MRKQYNEQHNIEIKAPGDIFIEELKAYIYKKLNNALLNQDSIADKSERHNRKES